MSDDTSPPWEARIAAQVIDAYHRVHPVTGAEFDYDHACRTCAHYSERTQRKAKIIGCALAPKLDGETFGQQRDAFVACARWQRKEPVGL